MRRRDGTKQQRISTSRFPSLPPLGKDYLQPDMIPTTNCGRLSSPAGKRGHGRRRRHVHWLRGSLGNRIEYPFRKYKHWVHEGGISTPLVVHLRRGGPEHGRLESTPGHLIDLMATAVDVGQATYPSHATPLEGKSLAPLWRRKNRTGRDLLGT